MFSIPLPSHTARLTHQRCCALSIGFPFRQNLPSSSHVVETLYCIPSSPAVNVVGDCSPNFPFCVLRHTFTMQFDVRQAVAGALTLGMFVALLDMMISGPIVRPRQPQELTLAVLSAGEVIVEEPMEKTITTVRVETPKKLWGLPGPVLQPCWSKHIASKQGKTKGYVLVKLSNGPLFHPLQVADAVIVARSLGAILVLPKIKEAAMETNGGFSKIYDVDNFIGSLKGVVRVVARLPEDVRSVSPTVVKVPYKVTPEYIDDILQPLFSEKRVIEIISVLSTSNQLVKDTSTQEIQAIRCLVMYSALQFHPRVKKLGEQVVSSLKETSGVDRFIAVDLRVDLLDHTGCRQPENSKGKKCFDASDVGTFLKRSGFSSSIPIFLTQSRWDERLDPLKDNFPNVYTKDQSLLLNGDQQTGPLGGTQLEKAIDLYICTHSDVFVPAISGISYVNIAGKRISEGRTQILVPTLSDEDSSSSKLQVSRVLSRFVTKKDHAVYSCFCKAQTSTTSKPEK